MTVDIHTPSQTPQPKRRVEMLPPYFRPLKTDLKRAAVITGVVLAVMMIGLPRLSKPKMDLQNPVTIDLVDLKDIKMGPVTTAPNTTRVAAPPKPTIRKEKPPEEPPKPAKTDVKPPEPKPEKPPEKTPEKPAPAEDAISLDKPKDKPKPEKPKPDKPKPKPVEKPKPNPNQQADFSNMLKNLVGEEQPAPPPQDEPAADKPVDAAKPTAVAPTYGQELTLSEMDALRHQLAGCWNVPTGAMDAENLIVDVQVVVRPDRTVQSATIVDQGRYNSDTFFRAAADSARRAVLNPSCSPLLLPPDQYETWKNMVVRFNPREMFGGL